MSIAVICNSRNADLRMYFELKLKGVDNPDVVYYAQKQIAQKNKISISSFSPEPGWSKWIILDVFYGFLLALRLLTSRVKIVLFDTAHISNLVPAIILKVFGKRLVFTIHDWEPHEGRQAKSVKLYNWFVKKILASEFVVFSPVNSNKKVHELKLAGFSRKSSYEHKEHYLFFGRIEPYKGLSNLVKISKRLSERGDHTPIIVAGSGEDPAIHELSKMDNVTVINRYIEDSEVDSLFGKAYCSLLPYQSATQSGVIIQSYSYGTPVVSFDVGSLGNYITHNQSGVLVPPGDIEDFVRSVDSIRKNSNYFIEKTNNEFEKYDEIALVKQYTSLFSKLANGLS